MLFKEKVQMFNQKQIDKNMNPLNKSKEGNISIDEETKANKKVNDLKKEKTKEKLKIHEDKDKSKDIEKKDKKESFDNKKSSEIFNNINKQANKENKKEENTPVTMAEKVKSLDLYFKLRNEGMAKCYTESPKIPEKNDLNLNSNSASSKSLEKSKTLKDWVTTENETMIKLEIEQDAFAFNEDNYKKRRYDKFNIESGKKFFKLRFIKNKIKQNSLNLEKKQKEGLASSELDDSEQQQRHDSERISRKYNSDFILTLEKSILSFNIKNYKESYEFLLTSGIIKNVGEYGEILLVVSGFDKFLIGEFLAKQKYPNDNKEVLNNFIESINMTKNETRFIDCLRFIFSRLILPKDANLILEIMDKFSVNYFETNKEDDDFVSIFKSSDKVYLLVSTILALNTMFTRKDIKIKNVIKKEEFIKMNSEIEKKFIEELYDELKKNPISMSDDYNESMYRKLAPLVKEDESSKQGIKNNKIGNSLDENRISNVGNEDKSEENNSTNNINRLSENPSKEIGIEEQTTEEDEDYDDFFDEDPKKTLEKKEFSLKTNLKNFTEEDEKILKTPHKLYKINGSNKSQREYILSDDKTKLYFDKKQKKFIIIGNIINVYNGVNHRHNSNIKKYLKSNPSEEQFSGNFISLIFKNDRDQVDLMSDDLESGLLWFKAIKSLILVKGGKNMKNARDSKFYEYIKKKLEDIWNNLLNKWNVYGKYIIMKLMERNNIIQKEEKQSAHLLINNINKQSNKNLFNFVKSIFTKVSKDKELDYNDFFCIYYLGLPNKIRSKIWQILIGNPYGIFKNAYELSKKQVPSINFDDLDLTNQSNKNYCQDYISNKIINEILNTQNLFITEDNNNNLDKNSTIKKVYNISRSFFIFRPDIPFNKSIISITFLLLIIFGNELNTFCNLVNLICSNGLKIFLGDENEIKNYCSFFNTLLKKYLGKIEKHFSKLEITPQLYIVPWFEELFTKTLNVKLLSLMFDLYLIDGEIILYQTSLAIIRQLEEELLNLTINEVFKALQRFPENASEVDLIRSIKKYSCIKKDFLDWKMQNELAAQKSELYEIILSSQ